MARGGAGPAGWGARRRGRRAWRAGGATWCTKTRYPLFLRSLCTKSRAFLRPWPAPTWCTKSCRPCSSVSFAPSPPRFFARGRRRLGARNPASPCSSVSFAPSPPRFFARGRAGVVPHRSLSLAIPCSFVLRYHVSEHRRKVMHQDFRLRASLFPYYIFKGKELTTNTTRPPFVVNSNHLPVPLAPTCIRHQKIDDRLSPPESLSSI